MALIEGLAVDRALRRICGFSRWKQLPDEATVSRAFVEFAESRLAERAHGALIKTHLSSVGWAVYHPPQGTSVSPPPSALEIAPNA